MFCPWIFFSLEICQLILLDCYVLRLNISLKMAFFVISVFIILNIWLHALIVSWNQSGMIESSKASFMFVTLPLKNIQQHDDVLSLNELLLVYLFALQRLNCEETIVVKNALFFLNILYQNWDGIYMHNWYLVLFIMFCLFLICYII